MTRRRRAPERALIVGAGRTAQRVAEHLLADSTHGVALVGAVGDGPVDSSTGAPVPRLGTPDDLPALVREHGAARVVFASGDEPSERTARLVGALEGLDVTVELAAALEPLAVPARRVNGIALVALRSRRLPRWARVRKRVFDVLVSAVALVVLAPLLAAIAVLVKLDSPGPVFFRQLRMGVGGRTFRVFKFRTMALGADDRKAEFAHLNAHGGVAGERRLFKIAGDPRVTRFGRFLRRYFLDELPQLLNVVLGEMSLVGPRPLILEEDRHVDEWARLRLQLRPGMTGLWQVLGNSAIPFEEMLKLDYLYVTTWSLRNDVRLLARTVPVVLRGGGGTF